MERPLSSVMAAEFYGTFMLTLLGPMAITVVENPQIFPLGPTLGLGFIGMTFGIAIIIGVVTVGHISGAHFNPAVTIGLSYSGRLPRNRVVPYLISQFVGAAAAGFVQLALVGVDAAKVSDLGNTVPNTRLPFPIFASVLAEIVGTMFLVMTVLAATDPSEQPGWKPAAIGLTLSAVIWATAGVAGASLNPARTFGPSVVSLIFDPSAMNYFWIYLVGPILGGLLAAELYRLISWRGGT